MLTVSTPTPTIMGIILRALVLNGSRKPSIYLCPPDMRRIFFVAFAGLAASPGLGEREGGSAFA